MDGMTMSTVHMWNLADPLSVSCLRVKGIQTKQNPQIKNPFPWNIARPHSALPLLFYLQAGLIAYIHYSLPLSQLCMQLVRLSSHPGWTWPTASTAYSMFPAPCPHPSAGSVWGGMVAPCCHASVACWVLLGYPLIDCTKAQIEHGRRQSFW